MKKASVLIGLLCLAFLAWTTSCKSPSSTGNPASSQDVNDSRSNSNNNNSNSNTDTAMGFLRLTIKDAPVDDAKNIWVKIGNIRVHRACNDGEDCFTTIWENPTGQDIDLIALKTTPFELPTATLPAGTYNQIRMDVIEGRIVFGPAGPPDPSDVSYPLDVPSAEIKTHLHFDLEANETIRILLDFDAKNSIHVIKKGKMDVYQLRPVIDVVEVVEGAGR